MSLCREGVNGFSPFRLSLEYNSKKKMQTFSHLEGDAEEFEEALLACPEGLPRVAALDIQPALREYQRLTHIAPHLRPLRCLK